MSTSLLSSDIFFLFLPHSYLWRVAIWRYKEKANQKSLQPFQFSKGEHYVWGFISHAKCLQFSGDFDKLLWRSFVIKKQIPRIYNSLIASSYFSHDCPGTLWEHLGELWLQNPNCFEHRAVWNSGFLSCWILLGSHPFFTPFRSMPCSKIPFKQAK